MPASFAPFAEKLFSEYLATKATMIQKSVQAISVKDIREELERSEAVDKIVTSYSIAPIVFGELKKPEDPINDIIKTKRPDMLGRMVISESYIYRISFTGDQALLKYRPQSYQYPLWEARQQDGNTIAFDVTPELGQDKAWVRSEAEGFYSYLKTASSNVNQEIDNWNKALPGYVEGLLDTKLKQFQKDQSDLAQL